MTTSIEVVNTNVSTNATAETTVSAKSLKRLSYRSSIHCPMPAAL